MTTQRFELPSNFPRVLVVLAAMNLQIWTAGLDISQMRKKIFNQEFMDRHFGQLHRTELREDVQRGGNPDNGGGPYSRKLSYADWYRFNVLQRIHLNYVENINLASMAVVAAGVVNANYGVGVGVAYMIGRLFYSIFYKKEKGARNVGRIGGIIVCHLATLTGIVLFLSSFIKKSQ